MSREEPSPGKPAPAKVVFDHVVASLTSNVDGKWVLQAKGDANKKLPKHAVLGFAGTARDGSYHLANRGVVNLGFRMVRGAKCHDGRAKQKAKQTMFLRGPGLQALLQAPFRKGFAER